MVDPRAGARRDRRGPSDADRVPPDVRVAERAAAQWGVLSLAELRECGLGRGAIAARVRGGRLHRLHHGVYAVGHASVPLPGRFLAAVKACGARAVLSHFSAAALWGLVAWDDRHPEVTVTGTAARLHPGVRAHRTLALEAHDVTRRDGIAVTSPARTLVDLAAVVEPRALRRAVREAEARHLTTAGQIASALGRLGPRAGRRRLALVLDPGSAPTRSELEDVVLDLLRRGGFEPPDVNVPLRLGGQRVVPDFRWPAARLVVEADGAAWHDHRLAREDDAERQALLEASGERVVRITWSQVVGRPHETLARLRAAGAPRAAATQARRPPPARR